MRSIMAYLCLCPANFRAKIDAGSTSIFLVIGSPLDLTPFHLYIKRAEESSYKKSCNDVIIK